MITYETVRTFLVDCNADQSMRHQTFRVNEPKRLESYSEGRIQLVDCDADQSMRHQTFRVNEPKRLESHILNTARGVYSY